MALKRQQKSGALCFRLFTFSTLIAMMAYGAMEPKQLRKVTAEFVTIIISAVATGVQFYVTVAKFLPLPYHIFAVIAADIICALGFIAAIAILSYWNINVVYIPRDNDPAAWFKCANAREWDSVLTDSGFGKWLNIVWCDIEVDGRHRLVGNWAARQKLHVMIGLSTVCLVFTLMTIVYTIFRAIYLGHIRSPKIYAKLRETFH
ncbi:unnamed protein product [Clonostachys byssicola]|uniref:MARVEL domain-containing protein n=1 Tax=Clonostachys byssicola TaxID=160290 RepID=A0A9N9U9Q6_9HYPO|nr:unnamed protein product [Clonostachys byssicola]